MYLKMGGRPDPPDPDDVMRSIQDISTERDILFDKSVVAYVASGVHMFNWKEVYSQIVDGAKEKAKDLSPTVNTLILRQVRIIPGAGGVEVDYNFEPLTNPNKSE
jgi:deoxycytidylate deaminase